MRFGGGIAGGYRRQRETWEEASVSMPEKVYDWPGMWPLRAELEGTFIRQTPRPEIQGASTFQACVAGTSRAVGGSMSA